MDIRRINEFAHTNRGRIIVLGMNSGNLIRLKTIRTDERVCWYVEGTYETTGEVVLLNHSLIESIWAVDAPN